MAAYFLRSKHLSRGNGTRATRAAAYRAGERIHDERTSEVYDHSDRRDVAYKEVVLPADMTDQADMAWTQDRSVLWNAAEHAGLRRNSRVAREWLVLLPPELTSAQRTQLVRTFARELADKYRCAVDVCVHEPRPGADSRNHHAHLLMTTREVTPDGLGPRTTLELGGRERHRLGIPGSSRDEYVSIRERWAQVTNEALREAGLKVRIDHRSLKRQGIDREPTPTIPEKVFYAERRSGQHSAAGDDIRARHRERVEARLKGAGELARVLEEQKSERKARALQNQGSRDGPKRVGWGALTREERNERRRERYRFRRAIEKTDAAGEEQRREAKRAAYRDRMRKDPEAVRDARRAWRKAHSEEVNQNQREYRKRHAQELGQKRREYRKNIQQSPAKSSALTAEEAAQRWKAYRESHGPASSAEESARNWLAFRDNQRSSEPSSSEQVGTREERRKGRSADDDLERKPSRRQGYDYDV
jgi:MobA/MobL family